MTQIKTDSRLLRDLRQAAKMPMSAEQFRQQRIDYIVASLSDESTVVTRAQVDQELRKFSGEAA